MHHSPRFLSTQCLPSHHQLSQQLHDAIKASASTRSNQKLHGQLISTGLDSSVFLRNHLLHSYSKCGSLDEARRLFNGIHDPNVFTWNALLNGFAGSGRIAEAEKLFDEMPHRDSVSWTTMMSGYFRHGHSGESVKVFVTMVRSCGFVSDPFLFTSVMKACGGLGSIELARQLHGLVEKFDFADNLPVKSSEIDMYIKCGDVTSAERIFERIPQPSLFCWNSMIYGYSMLSGVDKAFGIFTRMPERDSVSWNTMVSIFSQQGFGVRSLCTFVGMWNQGFRPTSLTYASVLSACAGICDLRWGSHLHARIIRLEATTDSSVGNGLIDMYAKCGKLRSAREVFNGLTEKNAMSWTSLISGVANSGLEEEALALFSQIGRACVAFDEFILATVLGICSDNKFIIIGEQLHGYTIKAGMESSVPVGNALVTMYSKSENPDRANRAFELMPIRDIISWTSMINAYSRAGNLEKAQECFDKMPERNLVTWNSIVSAFVQNGFCEKGFNLYKLMRKEGVNPDPVTFVTLLSACAGLAVLKLGIQIISHAEKFGFGSNVSVANSVVTLYSKCGRMEEAKEAFDSINGKNLISWNAIMAGYAQNGHGRKVIEIFSDMVRSGVKPDHISYVAVLSGCSHSGLVAEGKLHFASMVEDHGVSQTPEHFACMVDLLGRAGFLDEAKNLIEGLTFKPNSAIWGALLGACWTHSDSNLAEYAVRNLLELDSGDSGCYVILANIYSDSGNMEAFANVRNLMRERGIQKNPGCSWIEVENRVHVFTVNDNNHPRIAQVYEMLDEIVEKIAVSGLYSSSESDTSLLRSRRYHSEKLAVAFGLLSLPAWMPIHIMKNLRVCHDCHAVIKAISLVAARELVVRDGHRFHHFKDGICSCGDFW